jgi:hypothetical protein
MRNRKPSVTSGTAHGGWRGGGTARLGQSIQEVTERVQILNGYYNASTDYSYGINRAVPKQRRGIWAYMCKRQNRAISSNGDVNRSIARNFANIVRVGYNTLLRLIDHC